MAFGPGKYDELATYVRTQANANGVIVLVIGGAKGDGFSAQLDPVSMMGMPRILRMVADEIERTGFKA